MSLTPKQAVDDINSMFFQGMSSLGYKIHWEAVDVSRQSSAEPFFAFMVRHSSVNPPTLGGKGFRSFQRNGTAIAYIYCPTGKGLSESYILAKNVSDIYEGEHSENGVWFREVRIQEMGKDGEFYLTTVMIEFEYFEIK